MDTAFCSVESLITGIVDNWSEKLLPHRKRVAFIICLTCFFLGLPMCTEVNIFLIFISLYSSESKYRINSRNFSFFHIRVECTCSKSWTSMPLPDCHFYGFASLRPLQFLGFMAPVGLAKTSKKCWVINHSFSGICAGWSLLHWLWR